ncbi:LPXTG cell wall anchor domain-containing protein [Enterococcus faecium]|uniref:pilin N-terminal domain-containing protein n=1 Tax=Enterococcus faecium TaxID=1352 RepID=UPI0007798759|nr:pilin N-terminal domain-containing protein [Enterococcus faecium]AMP60829.1 hypothetical protein UB18_05035 [Enterococcus faecium]EMF0571915.1 LPXTG cell wall anchor domain-containing protein [Enterococcus faecium]NTK90652.1 LPXTG cell wall anchor domain-containing protein [Enterococcus faecium]
MKNIKTKIWTFLGTAIMLLPFVLGLGTAEVSAAVSPTPENVTVNLHKLKFTSAPENQINNGTELTFPNSEPLNGVEFNVYDITATYYPSKDTAVPADATPFASVTTSGEGLANLTLPGKSDGKDAVYVFVETPKPGVETSPNIVLSLPFYNPNSSDPDKPLDTIHLYAKNVIKESNIKIQKAGNFSGVDKLAGAQFQIKNSENQFVTGFDENTGVALYDPAESALTFTTDTEGSISVNGLIDGNYTLVETKAPEGYALPKNEAAYTEFTVDDDPTTSDETTIDNQPKGILPSTGGMGIIVFILVGTALVGGAVIYFKKRHQETEA